MSGYAIIVKCDRCGVKTYDLRRNPLIGGWYCVPCDSFITKPDPKLEAKFNRRVAARKAREATA